MTIHRRSFITGLVSLVAAPAIVRAGSLMPVKTMLITAPNMTATEVLAAEAAWTKSAAYQLGDMIEYEGRLLMAIPSWVLDQLRASR